MKTEDYGRLMDYLTASELRPATQREQDESRQASEHDGGAGVILVAGRRCYVED